MRSLRYKRTVKQGSGEVATTTEAVPFYDCETFIGEGGQTVTFDTMWERIGVPEANPYGEGGSGESGDNR